MPARDRLLMPGAEECKRLSHSESAMLLVLL
jgi:hypothetical protein